MKTFKILLAILFTTTVHASQWNCTVGNCDPYYNDGNTNFVQLGYYTNDAIEAAQVLTKMLHTSVCDEVGGCAIKDINPTWNSNYKYWVGGKNYAYVKNPTDVVEKYNNFTRAGFCR